MNGKDKISVIIPCYNVQKYIMRCFDSIYSQTYGFENLEVILIDDLSTDNTWSIYEFVNNVGDRHNHNCYLVMVTMNTLPEQLADIEEIEKALDCMEQSIRSKIRKVDVCTRYSSMQYLIILFEPQENQIPNVMERIFMHYYELCDRENFKPQYEYIKMTEVK